MHMITHYFDINNLISEYEHISAQYHIFINMTNNNTNYETAIHNYKNIVTYTLKLINEKLIIFGSNKHTKRGLINGIGSIIKQITGNLDYEDGNHFETVLNHLKENENKIANQVNRQYSINKEIMKKFNATIKIIEHNELVLLNRILPLEKIIEMANNNKEIAYSKDLINQMLNVFQIILDILQDIENSIGFCKLNILHSSIISSSDLLKELIKISDFYKNQLPFPVNMENIINYETLIKPQCLIKNGIIIYFLPIPIIFEKSYNLYYFLSIPNKNLNLIIPSSKYAIQYKSEILPLAEICVSISNTYHCNHNQILITNNTCERNLLLHNSVKNCLYTKLKINENMMEYIPELNQYLAIFTKEETIKEKCFTKWSTFTKKGIFLFENSNCTTIIREKSLLFNDVIKGKPIHIENIEFNHESIQDANNIPELKMKHIKLSKLDENLQLIEPMVENSNMENAHRWSTIFLYLLMMTAGGFLIFHIIRRKRKPTSNSEPCSIPLRIIPAEEINF